MYIKICGITRVDQGQAIAQMGVTALGFICVPGTPRYVTPETMGAMIQVLPVHPLTGQPVDRIGVFLNASIDEICRVVTSTGLNGVQLHGQESPEFCLQLRMALPDIRLIKALRIRSAADLAQAHEYQEWINVLLLDAYHPHQPGGTGQTLDWSQLAQFRPTCDWWLAGGLRPENVQTALRQIRPDGIDLSSGVERAPGDKDLDRVRALFQALDAT